MHTAAASRVAAAVILPEAPLIHAADDCGPELPRPPRPPRLRRLPGAEPSRLPPLEPFLPATSPDACRSAFFAAFARARARSSDLRALISAMRSPIGTSSFSLDFTL
jgi:hypothetical protein